jgi:thioredoxin 1
MSSIAVSDASFETDVLKAAKPVLVDFWAEWCAPCKQIGPHLEALAGDMSEKLTVAKVNIDDSPRTPGKYGVRGIPTLILFKGGEVAAMRVGSMSKTQLYSWIESVV